MTSCDVLIVGGGPAGLLAASKLAVDHDVTLIESSKLGQRSEKFWVTSERRLAKHDLSECIVASSRSMTIGTFLGGNATIEGDFAVTDDKKVLLALIERCRTNGVTLVEDCELVSIRWGSHNLSVGTTKQTFTTKLLIDATGGASPIAKTFRLHQIHGFFAVFGGILENINLRTSEIVLGHVCRLGHPPPIFEVVPAGANRAYCVVFIFSKTLLPPSALREQFDRHCKLNPFFEWQRDSSIVEIKSGAIPIGKARRRRLRGVVSLGEAGLVQPPLMATAFNEVLEYTDHVCQKISNSLVSSNGIPAIPRHLYPLKKRLQDKVQMLLARTLLTGDAERFDSLVQAIGRLPNSTVFNLLSNELSWRELLQLSLSLPRVLSIKNSSARPTNRS